MSECGGRINLGHLPRGVHAAAFGIDAPGIPQAVHSLKDPDAGIGIGQRLRHPLLHARLIHLEHAALIPENPVTPVVDFQAFGQQAEGPLAFPEVGKHAASQIKHPRSLKAGHV